MLWILPLGFCIAVGFGFEFNLIPNHISLQCVKKWLLFPYVTKWKWLTVNLVSWKIADPVLSHNETMTKHFCSSFLILCCTTINRNSCESKKDDPESGDEIQTYSLPSLHFLLVALADQSLPDLPKDKHKTTNIVKDDVLIVQVDDTSDIPRHYKNMSWNFCGVMPKIVSGTTDDPKLLGYKCKQEIKNLLTFSPGSPVSPGGPLNPSSP